MKDMSPAIPNVLKKKKASYRVNVAKNEKIENVRKLLHVQGMGDHVPLPLKTCMVKTHPQPV